MKILLVHNKYGAFSGEEALVESLLSLLKGHGCSVATFFRSSSEVAAIRFGKVRAFFSGMYSFESRREIGRLIRTHRPDVVHIHNLFPWISPSILPECRLARVPVVMTVHNYRLVCPNGLHMPKGKYEICERCCGGREYWCVLRCCEQEYFKSLGYALRTYTARHLGLWKENVTLFACLTEFQRERLLREGFPGSRLRVLPNMCLADTECEASLVEEGDYVGYAGRISPEKGIGLLLAAAENLPAISFHLAGRYDAVPHLIQQAPVNVSFLGNLDKRSLSSFYRNSRFIVLCSDCFEGFPMTILEAMTHARPMIASRIGGIPEIVEEGRTGLLFAPGDANELTGKIRHLWDRPDLCYKMGQVGREKASREYSAVRYYDRLMTIYEEAIKIVKGDASCT